MNGKPWTLDHTATLERLNAIGCPDDLIAYITGHARETVQRRRSMLGISAAYSVRYADWRDMPEAALAAIVGRSPRYQGFERFPFE
jgi:hypothetical protein